ncbi:TetR/AcrR family transcriptional regulator [Rossellomorea sp. AcN35-11]|nr:TetR/AcrR family transcriptional regulator [Rossellomorea aquimaris]NMH68330.1 TetR/AcrR family transcriptional regulator [Bacillus sp. RO3]WJV29760.1 TetR/AcrR family transcriptional regulator [Rossellomorea sp. AcN35-11]
MAGLREDKKQQTQLNIMESAKKIFSEKGFQQASMAEIARDAEVGTGTIYNYFPSKGALLLRIFSEEAAQLKVINEHHYERGDVGVVDSLITALHQFAELFTHYPKAFWRDLFHVMTEEVEESVRLRQGLFGIDEEMMKWIIGILENESDCFLVPVDPEEAAYAIFSASMSDTIFYMYNEAMTHEEYKEQISRHIAFLFAGKIKSGNGE